MNPIYKIVRNNVTFKIQRNYELLIVNNCKYWRNLCTRLSYFGRLIMLNYEEFKNRN